MSILREVIKSVEEIEWSNLNERLPILISNVHLCRSEIFNMLDEVYIEFIQKPVKRAHYSNNLLELKKELEILHSNCEQGIKRETHSSQKYVDYKTLLQQVQDTYEIFSEVESCYHIHEKFVDLQLYKIDCEKSLQILKEIKDIMETANYERLSKYYRKHFKLTESAMHLHFGEVLMTKFIFEVKEQRNISYIKVKKNIDIGNSIALLLQYQAHIKQLEELMEFLWEFIFIPIVTCGVTMTSSETEIKLKIKKTSKPYYEDVFKRMHDVTNFLKNNFNIYIDRSNTVTLLEYIGNQLKERISPFLVSRCLKNIHKTVGDGKSLDYDSIIKQVEALQMDLNSAKLVKDDSLLEHAMNLCRIHFSRAQDKYFEHMRLVMSKKNHDIVRVGSQLSKKFVDTSSDLLSMSISSDVQELNQLTETILLEAKTNEQTNIIDTVFNLFKFYRKYTMKDVEQMNSREVALLYNNYTFITYELREWNIFYSELSFEDDVPLFKEELIIFQVVAEETLENFLTKEVNKLKSHLHKLSINDTEISCECFENIIKKCLKQIASLKESWFDLLSQIVFNRSIGVCFNVLCDFLIKFILKFDIDKTLIDKCSTIFNSISKLIEEYFVDVTDLKKLIKCWGQFQALSLVLKSDIVEVDINKYHELLKSNFEPYEVKKIIKAIFHPIEETDTILYQLYN